MYDKRLRKEFKKIDKDGGGFVDISELSAYILKKYKHRFRLGKFKVSASEKFWKINKNFETFEIPQKSTSVWSSNKILDLNF